MEVDDRNQQAIVELSEGNTLLLAGPGCGKTHILARRIFHANAILGIPFEDMLNVTFTNRAAREMKSRITAYLGYHPSGLFVGNLHRFCLRFLHLNNLVPTDMSVLDEDDQVEFLREILHIPTAKAAADFLRIASYLYQVEHDHPDEITLKPWRSPDSIDYERYGLYKRFKTENRLMDFDEILLRTYTALSDRNADKLSLTGFKWIQVDETQDMTPLQLAIIGMLSERHGSTSLFLGDEQQAIFSFIGAGGRALDRIKAFCKGNISRLRRNYRSPDYLVNLCNDIALTWLGIDRSFLSEAVNKVWITQSLTAFKAFGESQLLMTSSTARQWLAENPTESVLILTATNAEGDALSSILSDVGIEHFHISRQDVFHQIPFRTVWSHLAVTSDPLSCHPWARILYQTHTVHTLGGARSLLHRLRSYGVAPDELLKSAPSWRIPLLCNAFQDSEKTVIVFDTETTGLDVFEDDVVQIAAVKIRGGEIVPDSRFEVFIETSKPLPVTLGDSMPNPLLDIYFKSERFSPEEAFRKFAEYIGEDSIVAGHNVDFDCAIIRNHMARIRCGFSIKPIDIESERIDTLALSRLLYPRLNRFTLKSMIEILGVDGENSHNASDDVMATTMLMKKLFAEALKKLPVITRLAEDRNFQKISRRLKNVYGQFYYHSRLALTHQGGLLSEALEEAYSFFINGGMIGVIPHFNYFLTLADSFIVEDDEPQNLRDILGRHIHDITAFSESDLFAYGIVNERLSVMTIHKAKGLEADNVILFDGRRQWGSVEENARLLYVACSRARKRLCVGFSDNSSPILQSVLHHFTLLPQSAVNTAVISENMHREA